MVLKTHAPTLMESVDPEVILPYLMRHRMTTRHNEELIRNRLLTTRERNEQILDCVLYRSSSLTPFLDSLEESGDLHPPHIGLARILRAELKQGIISIIYKLLFYG